MLLLVLTTAAHAETTAEEDPVCPDLVGTDSAAFAACTCIWDSTLDDWTPTDESGTDPTGTCFEFTAKANPVKAADRALALKRLDGRAELAGRYLALDHDWWCPGGSCGSPPVVDDQLLTMVEPDSYADPPDWPTGFHAQGGNVFLAVDWLGQPLFQLRTLGDVPTDGFWVDDDDDGERELIVVFQGGAAWKITGPLDPGILVEPPQ